MTGGYAVIDVETTGFGRTDRVVEVAVVHVDPDGTVTGEWDTVLQPDRGLGPTGIHGLTDADVRDAPRFAAAAGRLAGLLAGRVVVGHHLAFDVRMLAYEYARLWTSIPVRAETGLCTMRLARTYLPGAGRSLSACCAAAGVRRGPAHSALTDARDTAALLGRFLRGAGTPPPWQPLLDRVAVTPWPSLPAAPVFTPVSRTSARRAFARREHFLARLTDRLPRAADPGTDPYLGLLDRALLDRVLSLSEQDTLVQLARDVGLHRSDLDGLHRGYLAALARAALEDGVVTPEEQRDLERVAALLALSAADVEAALAAVRHETLRAATVRVPRRRLPTADLVAGS